MSSSSQEERRDNRDSMSQSGEDDLEEDYYLILNVPKDASDKDITQAYHRLGLIYHPDKHKDPENKRNAEILFSKIKKVYDVLINPHKRAIYDSLGAKGLIQDNMQLVIRSKTPKEIREEYERLSKEQEERRLEKLTYSQGHFTMQVDASRIFDSLVDKQTAQRLRKQDDSYIQLGNFEMQQSIEFPLSSKETMTVEGRVGTERAFGTGMCTIGLRRLISSDTILNFKGILGAKKGVAISAYKRLTKNCNGEISSQFRYRNGTFAPIFVNTINYQLDQNLIGQLQFRTDAGLTNTAMATALVYEKDNWHLNARLQLSARNSFISLNMARVFTDYDLKLKSYVQYGFLGATFSYGVEKQVTKFSRLDASITINSMAGVILNLEVNRGFQSFMLPVHLSHEIVPSAIFYGTVTPLIVYYVARKLVLDPYMKRQEEEEAKKKQEKLKSELSEKKKLAQAAQNLMKEAVERIIEKEGANGLIITKALYGKIEEEDKTRTLNFDNEKIIDVKVALQFLVKDHTLQIFSDQSKSSLEGFYDPCFGETKTLYVEYTFNGETYKASIGDTEFIRLPKSSHKVQWWTRPFSSVKT